MDNKFKQKLNYYGRRRGYKHKDLAKRLFVDESTFSKWVNGGNPWPDDALESLCEILGLDDHDKNELVQLARLMVEANVLRFFEKQRPEANTEITAIINAQPHPKTAQLIQYSSGHVQEVIDALLDNGILIELLLQHPKTAKDPDQKLKICDNVVDFQNRKTAKSAIDNDKFFIRLYWDIATVRAVRLDNEIFIGYYTYETNKTNEKKIQKEGQVHGHDNFVVHFPAGHPDTPIAIKNFERTFQALFDHSESLESFLTHYKEYLE